MKSDKKNKGITLIVLTITIIILLTLAGITIVQLTEKGLFGKAKEVKETRNKSRDERKTSNSNIRVTNR